MLPLLAEICSPHCTGGDAVVVIVIILAMLVFATFG